MFGSRSRTCSESSEASAGDGMRPQSPLPSALLPRPESPAPVSPPGKTEPRTFAYDLDGKFTYSQVLKANLGKKLRTTVDENGKFSYISADMRPVPPGWYDVDKTKHRVPIGWYEGGSAKTAK